MFFVSLFTQVDPKMSILQSLPARAGRESFACTELNKTVIVKHENIMNFDFTTGRD